jgi:hypothetical protein
MHIWATNASTTLEAMVNPVIAACDGGVVPDRIAILILCLSNQIEHRLFIQQHENGREAA